MTRSGTGGPCNHCGRTHSPCWRKGPPDKPLLCNACGSRYLVKKDLTNYWPGSLANGSNYRLATQAAMAKTVGTKQRFKDSSTTVNTGSVLRRKRELPRTETADNFDDSWDRAVRLSHSRTDSSKSSISGYAPITPRDDGTTTDSTPTYGAMKQADAAVLKVTVSAVGEGPDFILIRQIPLEDGRTISISRRPRKQLKPMACAVL